MNTLIATSLVATSVLEKPITEQALVWTPEEIMGTKMIADVQHSPDNKKVLFVVSEARLTDELVGTALSTIYKAEVGKLESVSALPLKGACTQPRWSPDGQWIAFLSNHNGMHHLYLMHAEGGEIFPLTKEKRDVQTFAWSPNSQKIACVIADETEREKRRDRTSLAYEYKQDPFVNRLWVIDIFSPKPVPTPLTPDHYCVRGCGDFGTINCEFDWSPDSTRIVFAHSASMSLDDFYLDSHLAVVEVATGDIVDWNRQAPYEALPRYSPNGEWVAHLANDSPQKYAINRQVALRSKEGVQQRLLAPTFNEGAFLSGPTLLGWSAEGKELLFFEPVGTKFQISLLPMDGSPAKRLETETCFLKDPVLSRDRTRLGFVAQAPHQPPEAYSAPLNGFKPIALSAFNQGLTQHPYPHTESISWESHDGLKIEGLLTYPLQYQEGKQYPLLLVVHGGPMTFFDETFLGTPQPYPLMSFAELGFAVFRPNPRGSCGYGKSFRCANYGDWGGKDFIDILSGVDALIERGIVDPNRLGVMGWSYGGYMAAWMVSQTARFKAASLGAGVYNLTSLSGTTDLHRFLYDYMGDFIDKPERYSNRSPLYHAQNVATPCLIQHGVEDRRVPVSQAYEFYHALDRVGTRPTLLLYPGMGHRFTDPHMQLDAMRSNLAWFKQHLLGNS